MKSHIILEHLDLIFFSATTRTKFAAKMLHKNHNIFPVEIVSHSVMEILLCSEIPNTQSKDVQVMIGISSADTLDINTSLKFLFD